MIVTTPVEEQTLRRLARDGFVAARGPWLKALSEWCQGKCDNSGDGRFCILADTLLSVYEWWDEWGEAVGGVPTALVESMEALLRNRLIQVVDDPDPIQAARNAAALRQEIVQLLLPEKDWAAWTMYR